MHSPLVISLYGFAVLFLSLGAPCVLMWLLSRLLCGRGSRVAPNTPARIEPWLDEDLLKPPAVRREPAMPPPVPRDDREYFQAAFYAQENDLPLPPLPHREHHEDW